MSQSLARIHSKYHSLLPYERAVLLTQEKHGRKRRNVLDALLVCRNGMDVVWCERWEYVFLLISATATVQALLNASAVASAVATDGERTYCRLRGTAWADALRQLERETSAPFSALDGVGGATMLDLFPEIPDLPHRTQYRILRLAWDETARSYAASYRGLSPVETAVSLPPVEDGDPDPDGWGDLLDYVREHATASGTERGGVAERVLSRLSPEETEALRGHFAAEAGVPLDLSKMDPRDIDLLIRTSAAEERRTLEAVRDALGGNGPLSIDLSGADPKDLAALVRLAWEEEKSNGRQRED